MDNESEYDLEKLISKLRHKDDSLSEVSICNSTIMTKREDTFLRLYASIFENEHLTNIQLVNVSIKDSHCTVLVEALLTCVSLEVLNLESNELSNSGIEVIADMAEHHPSLNELHIANQRLVVGIEGEKALVNCLSQNTKITKLTHSFKDKNAGKLAIKYIQRNLNILQELRQLLKTGKHTTTKLKPEPYPYPKKEIPSELKLKAQTKLNAMSYKLKYMNATEDKENKAVTRENSEDNDHESDDHVSTVVFTEEIIVNIVDIYQCKEQVKYIELHHVIREIRNTIARKSEIEAKFHPNNNFFAKGGFMVKYSHPSHNVSRDNSQQALL